MKYTSHDEYLWFKITNGVKVYQAFKASFLVYEQIRGKSVQHLDLTKIMKDDGINALLLHLNKSVSDDTIDGFSIDLAGCKISTVSRPMPQNLQMGNLSYAKVASSTDHSKPTINHTSTLFVTEGVVHYPPLGDTTPLDGNSQTDSTISRKTRQVVNDKVATSKKKPPTKNATSDAQRVFSTFFQTPNKPLNTKGIAGVFRNSN